MRKGARDKKGVGERSEEGETREGMRREGDRERQDRERPARLQRVEEEGRDSR